MALQGTKRINEPTKKKLNGLTCARRMHKQSWFGLGVSAHLENVPQQLKKRMSPDSGPKPTKDLSTKMMTEKSSMKQKKSSH